MKGLNNILFVLLGVFILSSCKPKGVEYTINGTVNDASFNEAAKLVKVFLYERATTGFTYSLIEETTTDAIGNFSFTFPRKRALDYKIVLQKEEYFDNEMILTINDLKPNDAIQQNFSIYAHAWVKVRLKNESSANSYDDFIYKKITGNDDCEACCPNNEIQHFYGENVDTTFYCMVEGGQKFSYYYELSNSAFLGNEEVISIPLDTVSVETIY